MNLSKFPHSAMFVGVTACGKTEFLLKLLETVYSGELRTGSRAIFWNFWLHIEKRFIVPKSSRFGSKFRQSH